MRLDLLDDTQPGDVVASLREFGVNAVFLLTPFPPEEDELGKIEELDGILGHDIDLHLWLTVYRNGRYLADNPNESFVSTEALEEPWINPLSTKFRDDFIEGVGEIVTRLGPDGVFLDYFYVPLGPFDNLTLESFSDYMGANLTVPNITNSPETLGRFFEWRNEAMIETLRSTRREIPEVDLSLFVIMLEEAQRLARGQDVEGFAGIVDFIVPNTYHVVAGRDASWVGDGVLALEASGAGSIWSGVQGYEIPPAEMRKAVRSAIKSGAEGVIIFRYGTMTKKHWAQVQRGFSPAIPTYALLGLFLLVFVSSGCLYWYHRARSRKERSIEKRRKKGRRRR